MALDQFSADQAPPGPTTPPLPRPAPQTGVVLTGLLAALVLGGVVWLRSGGLTATLFAVGLAFGFVLFHSRFGFTSAWRQLVAVRQGAGLRAHMLMLAVAATLFFVLATGASFGAGATPTASLAPIGFGVLVGAFLFGAGMQIGGACASGTLFAVGSGQGAIVLTLAGFVVGSVLGAYTFGFWAEDLPSFAPVSLADTGAGYLGAWLITMAAIAAVVAVTYLLARGHRAGRRPASGHRPRRCARPAGLPGRCGSGRSAWPV